MEGDNGEPSRNRIRYSPEALLDEIEKLESKEIKSGLVHCNNAVINLDGTEVDLLNLSSNIAANLLNCESSSEAKKQKVSDPKIPKLIEKRFSSENNEFLNYLAQSITHENLGNTYQAVPYEFCIYQKNHFRLPRPNNNDKDPSYFLILVCPTDCEGGEIYLPDYRRAFFKNAYESLAFVIFETKAQYEILKVTKGLRGLVVYKIIENSLKIEKKKLGVKNTEKLKIMLKAIRDKNVVIPITEKNIAEDLCEKAGVSFLTVGSSKLNPDKVYSEVEDPDMMENHENRYLKFEDLLNASDQYEVGTYINLLDPKRMSGTYENYGSKRDYGGMSSTGTIKYYSFLLINPNNPTYPRLG